MLISTNNPVAFGTQATNIEVPTVAFDMDAHTFTVMYRDPNGGPHATKVVTGPIPAALQTAIETMVQNQIATAENVTVTIQQS